MRLYVRSAWLHLTADVKASALVWVASGILVLVTADGAVARALLAASRHPDLVTIAVWFGVGPLMGTRAVRVRRNEPPAGAR